MINNPIKSLEFDKEYTLTPQYVEPDLSLSEGKILLGEFDELYDNIMSIRTSDTLNYVDNTLFTTNLSVDNTVTVGTIKNSDKEYVISDNDNNMILKVDSNGLETTKIRATEFEGDVNGTASSAATADKLTTSRNIKLTGSVTGNANFDGSGNIEISTTTNHNHNSNYYSSTDSRTANTVLAAPNGSAGTASFRALVAADIPSLAASKITSGTFNAARIPSLAASKVTSGTFDAARIPNLAASKITSETFDIDRIPTGTTATTVALGNHNHDSNYYSSTDSRTANTVLAAPNGSTGVASFRALVAADIPSLAASKITSGTFDTARIPDLAASKITSGTFDAARIPTGINITGSSGSCTGNAATATTATNADKLQVQSIHSSIDSNTYYLTFSNINAPTVVSEYGTIYDCPTKFTCNIISGIISSPIFSASDKMNATNGFYETSDERLKDIVKPVKVDLERLSKLRKVYFTWKDNKTNKHLGMIAQDVKELYPELITEQNGQLSLAYDKLSVIALEAIDILYKENKELKEQLNNLENKCFDLEEKLIDLEVLIKKLVKNNK